jgi:FMN phosphatase YigB (HAD superfamily)
MRRSSDAVSAALTAPRPPIAVAAVGFDLGETLYHYRGAPMRWLEQARPTLERIMDAGGIDRSKAHVVAAVEEAPRPATSLRERATRAAASERASLLFGAVFDVFRRSLEAYPGAVETLAALKEAGFAVGALTNVPFGLPRGTIEKDLERLGLAPSIDCFVTSFEVGARKPRRAPFERLAAALAVELPQMAYVGNLPTDVSGSKAAGCRSIYLDWWHTGADYGQEATVHDLREIPPLLTPARPGPASG